MSLRYRLTIALGVIVGVVGALTWAVVWGTLRADDYRLRTHHAHLTLERYLELSVTVERYFAALRESLGSPARSPDAALDDALGTLRAQLSAVRHDIDGERAVAVDYPDAEEEPTDLLRVTAIERLIHDALPPLAAGEGPPERTAGTVGDIEARVRALVLAGVKDERAEVDEFLQREAALGHRIALAFAALAPLSLLAAVGAAWWLYRSLKRPIDGLIAGAQQIARGNLDHRVAASRWSSELAVLATTFNAMAEELAAQRDRLNAAKATLEREVALRTRELQEANLQLLVMDDARRRFFADISHELRTPLTIIRGEAEVTRRATGLSQEAHRAALQRIVEQTRHLTRLIDDLLTLARADAKGLSLEREPVDLSGLLADIELEFQTAAQQHGLRLRRVDDGGELCVVGDAQRLRQVFVTLVENALRYSNPGGTVTIRHTERGRYAVVAVEDEGIGIGPEDIERVFERFYRGANARRHSSSGTGLGLAVARSIVEAHGGSIDVTSAPGAGATFSVLIPAEVARERQRTAG